MTDDEAKDCGPLALKSNLVLGPNAQDDGRDAFEFLMAEDGKWSRAVERNRNGEYILMQTASAWPVWRAAVMYERERLCRAIKAADDTAGESDYMLDSDDCISVMRGTWALGPNGALPGRPR